ncbi:hypothetical protein HMPREF0058_2014, partial [Actinomyces urogenitalis DSM 15434]
SRASIGVSGGGCRRALDGRLARLRAWNGRRWLERSIGHSTTLATLLVSRV